MIALMIIVGIASLLFILLIIYHSNSFYPFKKMKKKDIDKYYDIKNRNKEK